ncbi:hypothetical protein R4513_10855 [Acinetobacter baumannii]|uniref:hypothetical protein n=1 Tax=Acinetobacter baumannii TaxID=470 RepID=UPI00244B1976|nr:hypothetical protein [Acinetobacter baumannii]MDH2535685.1 hypothetical protein [Acinetobacter baumannii]MDV7468574.1 hypothetical protein [Acinetobacter baumannii]
MSELTAKAADEIIKICNELIVDNIEGEKAVAEWRYQRIEKLESWAKAIRDANRKAESKEK